MQLLMRTALIFISVICFNLSCDRFPDPSFEFLEEYTFSYGNTQGRKFFAGDFVDDSVSFTVYRYNGSPYDSLMVIFEVIKGGGSITRLKGYTDNNSTISTRWRLGTQSFDQILRASVYDLSGKYLGSSSLVEYGFRTGEWDPVSGPPEGNMMGLVADTVFKFTLMVNLNTVYRQSEVYYLWEEIDEPLLKSARTINIDRKGVIYVTTWNGDVVKSTDHAKTWQKCTKPYPDRPYFIYITVANDNSLWVFDLEHPTRLSRDGGETWTDTGIEPLNGCNDVFRLKDGSLLFHGTNCCSLYRSFDEGLTWSHIETPGSSNKLFVNENDEIFICNQVNGVTILKSTDYGASFNIVYNVYPEWGTSMDNIFNKWNNFYYILIPGYGILKTTDLIHYEDFWKNSNLRNLFIDHNGILIAKDWDWNTVYYLKNP